MTYGECLCSIFHHHNETGVFTQRIAMLAAAGFTAASALHFKLYQLLPATHCTKSHTLTCGSMTGNIWAHLLPLIVLSGALLSGWHRPWHTEKWAFYENYLPILLCLGASVAYHTFMAHHQAYRKWLLLDVCFLDLSFT